VSALPSKEITLSLSSEEQQQQQQQYQQHQQQQCNSKETYL
jgi:hypothetical protein